MSKDDYIKNLARIVEDGTDWNKHFMSWISVKERLPVANVRVLVAYSDDTVAIAEIQNGIFEGTTRWALDADYIDHDFITPEITHWMPLPDPPKE